MRYYPFPDDPAEYGSLSFENRTGFVHDEGPNLRPRLYVDHDPSLIFPWTPHFLPGVFFAAVSRASDGSPLPHPPSAADRETENNP